jgi:hypothetical protein
VLFSLNLSILFMLKGSFTGLWHKAMLYTGFGWLILILMIWKTDHIPGSTERMVFLLVLGAGYVSAYLLGFFIKWRHSKRLYRQRETPGWSEID